MGLILNYAALLALASAVMAQECPIFYEGRIPKGSKPTLFDDKKASPYNTEFVKGKSECPVSSRDVRIANPRRPDLLGTHQDPRREAFAGKQQRVRDERSLPY